LIAQKGERTRLYGLPQTGHGIGVKCLVSCTWQMFFELSLL